LIALPLEGAAADFFEIITLRLPSQNALEARGICHKLCRISRASPSDLVRKELLSDLFESADHFKNAGPVAIAAVKDV
jgi:hypothetical protein